MKKLISKYLIRQGFKRTVKAIRLLNEKELNAKETIDFLFSKEAELITPWQFVEEISQLAVAMEERKPKMVMEIGTANGGTLFMASRLATADATIISVDLPGGKFGGGYPDWKVPIYSSFARKDQKLHLLRKDSHADSTFEEVKGILNGELLDYFFIDGDHTYEGVKLDFEKYRALVKPGGMVVFHDIVVHPESACDVYRYWNEVKEQYPHRTFVKDWEQAKFGIGVLDYQ